MIKHIFSVLAPGTSNMENMVIFSYLPCFDGSYRLWNIFVSFQIHQNSCTCEGFNFNVMLISRASGVNGSFGEMLLLIAIHFHSNQTHAIADLVCTTLGMKVSKWSRWLLEKSLIFKYLFHLCFRVKALYNTNYPDHITKLFVGVYWFSSVRLSIRPTCRVRSVTPTVLDRFFPY